MPADTVEAGLTAPTLSSAPRRIHEAIAPWVQRQPSHLAVQDAQHCLSYQQLCAASDALAQQLQQAGVGPGDRLLVVGENCVAACALFVAASKLDAWVSIVNARLSEREIAQFKEHSGARRVVYLTHVSPEAVVHARHAEAVGWDTPVGALGLGPLNAQAQAEPCSADPAEQVAALVYTSGTTGHPKGVMLTHANLLFVAQSAREIREIGPRDRVYGVLPMAHVVGLSTQFLGSLCPGASLLLEARFTPEAAARALGEQDVTLFVGVPALFARLLEWSRSQQQTLRAPALRLIGVAGSPLTPSLKAQVEQALGQTLHNGYGLTETGPTIAQTRGAPRADCAVGQPIPGVEASLRGPGGLPVAAGQVGELWVRSPGRMRGYYRDAATTAQVLDAAGWFNTGDMARQGADGALEVVGRSKELIIRSGFNVYPVEVEQVLNSHAAIVQSAVVGREGADNEEVVAFVEVKAGMDPDLQELRQWLRAQLSPYKVPSEIRIVPALPAAPTGKILKHVLKHWAGSPAV
ncbi:class I adenylate-forming enzyme family protein [Comamonas terrigena]|uniref:class I adenylate-forming enzyme family protein n=1 Tax=Comamonas terrigena TaxID=32013 RepID=UPI0028AB205F|nr:AMP-binding protein [Comamonas terrigena]